MAAISMRSPPLAPSTLGGATSEPVDGLGTDTPHTQMVGGCAVFDSASLRVRVSADAQLLIENKVSMESYVIRGDGHLTMDDGSVLQFWGTTSFVFDDGTKLTVQTPQPRGAGPKGATTSTPPTPTITLVHGDYGVQIRIVDSASGTPALAIDERPDGGAALDAAVADGNVMFEDRQDAGFVALGPDGSLRKVDQAHIDATDLYQLRQLEHLLRRLFRLIQSLLTISMWGHLAQLTPPPSAPRNDDAPPPRPRPRPVAAAESPCDTLRFDTPGGVPAVGRLPVLHVNLVRHAA